MATVALPGHGLMFDGHAFARTSAARTAAFDWLVANGADEFDADQATETADVQRAWWGGDELGFVGRDHELAEPVTIVHLPDSLTGAGGQ